MVNKKLSTILLLSNVALTAAVTAIFLVFLVQMPNSVPILFDSVNGVTNVAQYASKYAFLPIVIAALCVGLVTILLSARRARVADYGKATTINIVSFIVNGFLLIATVAIWAMVASVI